MLRMRMQQAWFLTTYQSPDPETFYKWRGACDYAKKELARM